jgi:hypothetical protein
MTKSADPRKNPKLHTPTAPEGYELVGVSTLLDEGDNVRGTWVKTKRSRVAPEDLAKVYKDAMRLVESKYRPVAKPTALPWDDGLTAYVFGDPHLGMLAWPAESGKAWDLKIATESHAAVMSQLVAHAPETRHAVLANMGDAIHADGSKSKTFAGTEVDTDGRYPKILRATTTMLIGMAELALSKAETLHLVNVRGNHDTDVSVAVSEILRAHFRNEPRVKVVSNVALHTYLKFGQNLFGFHHGHATKAKDLPQLMATDRPVAWGQTKFRKWFCGHVHHETVKEHLGCTVETYNTLASQDAWHAGQGYRATQKACCEIYQRSGGRMAKYEVSL